MDTWYGAQWSLKNQVRNNLTSPFLFAQLEKTKILKMSNFCRNTCQSQHKNTCQSQHKNNVTHHPFPHHAQLTVHGVRKQLAVVFIDEVNVVSFLCQNQGKQFLMALLLRAVQGQLMQNDWEGQALASTWIFNQDSHYFKKKCLLFFKKSLGFCYFY